MWLCFCVFVYLCVCVYVYLCLCVLLPLDPKTGPPRFNCPSKLSGASLYDVCSRQLGSPTHGRVFTPVSPGSDNITSAPPPTVPPTMDSLKRSPRHHLTPTTSMPPTPATWLQCQTQKPGREKKLLVINKKSEQNFQKLFVNQAETR